MMNEKNKIRFAVTGIGIVSPLGVGKEINWKRLINGESAVRYDKIYEAFIARAQGFDMPDNTRSLAMAFIAAQEALCGAEGGKESSKSLVSDINCGLVCGESKLNLFNRNFNFENSLTQQLRRVLRARGQAFSETRSISAACATGALAIIKACNLIADELCDTVLCGCAETSIHPLYMAAFKKMGVLSKKGHCPFDKDRDGFAIGEGAVFLLIENMQKAVLRAAKIYGEIAGVSCGIYTDNPVSVSSSKGMEQIIKRALNGNAADFIHAHGAGTKLNDYYESKAIKNVCAADGAGNNPALPFVSSTKAATGHLLGVSGMLGAAFSILAINNSVVAPTLNFKETDIPFGLNYAVNKKTDAAVNSALSLSFGFGGQGAAVYLKKSLL
ncbi:MAG: hypothetical protein LBQ47_03290 [Endomicrobium sp.]|jgi:3-oxoacyl-[acyl-carrier-protein] synthase II|nr:hypothetical protein [Endomicrobium sp.]